MKKRKDGRWIKTKMIKGQRIVFYSTAKTEREALRDIESQMLEYQQKAERGKTFKEVAELWQKERWSRLQNNTLKQYRAALKQILSYFGKKLIKEIEPKDISRFLEELINMGYASKTIKSRLLVLNLIFKFAVISNEASTNPCLYITLPKNLPKTKRENASHDDIINIVNNSDKHFGDVAIFLLYTGCRRGEAFALTPQDVDFEAGTVHISKTVEWLGNKPQIKDTPKTEAGFRNIPLPDYILDMLRLRKNQKYLFPGSDGELIHNSQVTRSWDRFKQESGINVTPHQLRHAYATMLFDAGIDVKTAQRYLGHTDIQTTLNIYTHLSEQRENESENKIKNYMNLDIENIQSVFKMAENAENKGKV